MKAVISSLLIAVFTSINLLPFPVLAQELIPHPDKPFKGKVGLTYKDSEPIKSELKLPETFGIENAPNILVVLIDDVGYGQFSTFGGSIPTPAMDRVAKNGLRYTQFHTTALCSPTRAALLTGRNHHSAGTGVIGEAGTGFPGYSGIIPSSAGTFAKVLQENGYSTSWYGKNHNVPDWETSMTGPFDRWPVGLGFDYFYGFVGGHGSIFSCFGGEHHSVRTPRYQCRRFSLSPKCRPG
ncbi:MAG: sulfatase-like hydrolase/transferase [Microcoleaceae cyanobacterium]